MIPIEASLDPLFMLECVPGESGGGIDFAIVAANLRAAELTDASLVGKRLSATLPRPVLEALMPRCQRAMETGSIIEEGLTGQGPPAYCIVCRIVPIAGGVAVAYRDISASEAEHAMRASLRQKETLLKEIHHRVKNNLQVIASLLNLQAAHISDPSAFEMFQESQNRVRSIALFHEKLYQSPDLARIDVADYLRNLAMSLISSFGPRANGIDIHVDADHVLLDVDSAVPCGLIANELITNSLKHAFPVVAPPGHVMRGRIHVGFRRTGDNELMLRIADDGVGLPEALSLANVQSLGLQIVSTLTEQLGGRVDVARSPGADVRVTFAAS
jgi:two-component sensor histidine kinase